MEKQHEFIQKATVKFLRLNDDLLQFPTLLMFRVHDIIEVVKDDEPTSHEQLLSIGHKTRGHLYPPLITTPLALHRCYCSDHDFFTRVVRNAIGAIGLFHPKNKKPLHEIVTKYFHNRFNCNYKPSTTIVVVIEVLRKFVFIGGGDSDRGEPAIKLQEELGESSLDIVCSEEDYSESELQDILGSIYSLKMINQGYKLSTNAPTEIHRLSQVEGPIRTLIFKGKSSEDVEDGCPICLDGFHQEQKIAKLPCSHMFHKNCALKWLPHGGSCPLCRSECKTPII